MTDPNADRPPTDAGWRAVAAELVDADHGRSLFSVFRLLAKAPIDGAIALAEDPAYRGHQKFFGACLTVWLAFNVVAMPRLFAWYNEEAASTADSQVTALAMTIGQYLEMAVLIVIGFFIYRLGATIRRSPLSYYKFALLSTGVAFLLSILLFSLRIFGIVAISELGGEAGAELVEQQWLIVTANVVTLLIAVAFLIAINKRYWGLTTRFVVPATFILAAIDVAVLGVGAKLLELPVVQSLLRIFS